MSWPATRTVKKLRKLVTLPEMEGQVYAAVPPPLPQRRSLPWGGWATTGLGLAIVVAFSTVQTLVLMGLVGWFNRDDPAGLVGVFMNIESLAMDGRVLWISMAISFPVLFLCCLGAIRLRTGISQRDYLALQPMRLAWWVSLPFLTAGFVYALGWLLTLAGAPETNEWMLQIGEASKGHPMVWVGVVILAPIAEEVLFRGFLFRGWEGSRLRLWGTIILTSIGWAIIHGQYDVYGLCFIFTLGLFLGWIRWKSGSLYAPILVHAVNNALAMWMVMRLLEQ